MSLLGRASRRYHVRHPAQLALAVAGVAIGVAVAVAIDLASESARRSFRLATRATSGAATHEITGGAGPLDERLLTRLRVDAGLVAVSPVVEATLLAGPPPGRPLRLVGIDPWSAAALSGDLFALGDPAGSASPPGGGALRPFLVEPGAVLLAEPTARELGVARGDTFVARAGGRSVELRLVGTIAPRSGDDAAALAGVVFADIATAQERLDRPGELDRIELALDDDEATRAAELARAHALLPPGATIAPAAARPESLDRMTRAFRFNLRALSLLALLCGSFLVYNAITFSVVERRPVFGRLRALGATRGEILRLVLGEALVLGAAGTAAGVALGVVLGRGLTALVLATVRDLYFADAVSRFAVPGASLARGVLVGLAAALVAALVPALEAAASPPRTALLRSELEARVGRLAGIAALAGATLALLGGLLLLAATESLPLTLAAFFLVLVGAALTMPWLLGRAMAGAARLFETGTGGPRFFLRTGARAVGAALSRTGVAVAALALAVSVSIAVAVMIASFRDAVAIWLDRALVGDLYVGPPATSRGAPAGFGDATVAAIRALPGVARVNTLRTRRLDLPGAAPARVVGLDLDDRGRASFRFVEGSPDAVWRELATRDDAAILSEPFATRRGLHVGDTFLLPTVDGERRFTVAGIHFDYGSEQGAAIFDDRVFRARFGDVAPSVLAVFLAPGAGSAAVARAIEAAAPPGSVEVRAAAELKTTSLEIFDRTFAVTAVLRLLAIAVAVLGILAALAAYELDRGRELALLRALGLTRPQLLALVGVETGWIGLAAGCLAMPLGALLAALLVHVVNRRSFGWSMPLLLPVRPFVEALALAIGAALLAGLLPALRVARADPALRLRDE